jgi:hypothetical protein
MFSIIGLAIFTTLNNGIKIWQRLNQTVGQEDINIFFERIARELRNTFAFNTIRFSGENHQIAFATFLTAPGVSQPQQSGIGQVVYYYDRANKQLIKEQRNYSQLYKGDSGAKQELLKQINSLEFSYYYYDQESREYLWLPVWQDDYVPQAVRIKLEFDDGKQLKNITRSIDLPLAQSQG